ncbi:MAG: glucans biosynthesis glucosyltransferase MdoH [Burkholderiaceae bacterium]|nr:glucans biosynthesis glucosyltransferase MdoH [Burkholderiaceae bacterium]
MVDGRDQQTPEAAAPAPDAGGDMRLRRLGFACLVVLSCGALLWLMAKTLFVVGPDPLGLAMLVLFGLTLPWTTIGFWHAVIGFSLMCFARHPEQLVAPHLRSLGGAQPISSDTALLVCIRNEDTHRLRRNLAWMLEGLAAAGELRWFHLYLLSDTSESDIAQHEAQIAAALSAQFGPALRVTYRRREQSTGFKAGNIRDFCERWGDRHPFAIVLDADSVMSPAAMRRLVRIMQACPRIGILQTLVTGLPSASPFARIFQFGMRLGMRSYTLGAASWQGDCGPYWGHNAILRLAPFIAHCDLPLLAGGPPLGGHVLSHDQLEAVLMRRAGYEVRVLPDEEGSWEENPPNLPEFIRRDLRWCQGNMQYFRLLAMPGLLPVSRWQLVLAILMYVGAPAWMGFTVLGLCRQAAFRLDLGLVLFAVTLAMGLAPKLATLADVLLRAPLRRAYGGGLRVMASALLEIVFSMLIAPVSAVAVTIFIIGLFFRRRVGWTSQQRDAQALEPGTAVRALWPQTLVGIGLGIWLWRVAPGAVWYWTPLIAGLAGSIPIALVSAHPRLGRALARAGLCRIPEEARPADGPPVPRALAPVPPYAAQESK